MGWFLAALLASAVLISMLLWRLFNPPPLLEITERGIFDRRLRAGWIRWEDVEGAYRDPDASGEGVCLRVRVNDRLWRRLRRPRSRPAVRMPERIDIPIDLHGTQLSEVELLQEILANRPEPPAPAAGPDASRVACR